MTPGEWAHVSDEVAALTDELADWADSNAKRDDLVRRAITAGISKHRIHAITGIARTTIDRIDAIRGDHG